MQDAELVAPSHVRVRVPSKVNLFLAVRGLRSDGYHELVSIMQTVSIHDTVTARMNGTPITAIHPSARRFMTLDFQCVDATPNVPPGEDNLCVLAARRLMAWLGLGPDEREQHRNGPVTTLQLDKSIPVGAGMAGGSADAAGTLVALNALWAAELDRDELRTIAADVGADVPFCVLGGTALATGTGTATAQVLTRGTYHWVVGISNEPLSTPQVYRTFDQVGQPSEHEPDAVLQALRTGDAEALGAALHNDLEAASFALRPSLRERRDAFLDAGALGAVVSGSGPTVVALVEDAQHAAALAERMRGDFDRIETAVSPAGGPDLACS